MKIQFKHKNRKLWNIPDFPHLRNNCGWVTVMFNSVFLGETYSSNSDSLSLELKRDTRVTTSHPPNADRTLVGGTFDCLVWHLVFRGESSTNSSFSKKLSSFDSALPDFFCLLRRFVWNAFVMSSVDRTGAERARIKGRRVVFVVWMVFPWKWACLASVHSLYVASLSLYWMGSDFYCKKHSFNFVILSVKW